MLNNTIKHINNIKTNSYNSMNNSNLNNSNSKQYTNKKKSIKHIDFLKKGNNDLTNNSIELVNPSNIPVSLEYQNVIPPSL